MVSLEKHASVFIYFFTEHNVLPVSPSLAIFFNEALINMLIMTISISKSAVVSLELLLPQSELISVSSDSRKNNKQNHANKIH